MFGTARVFGNAWVFGNAKVYGNAWVSGDAKVFSDAKVYGNARVSDSAIVYGDARVFGNAWVYGDAKVFGNAQISKSFTAIVRSDGYTFIYVPCADGIKRIIAGCRYFTMEEARAHWSTTRGGTPLGDETMKILDFFA